MSATGQMRGHRVTWDGADWRYDDGVIADSSRPCVKCGEPPTVEGYDACIGDLPDAESVCCGHGIEAPYLVKDKAEPRREEWARRLAPLIHDGLIDTAQERQIIDKAFYLARLLDEHLSAHRAASDSDERVR